MLIVNIFIELCVEGCLRKNYCIFVAESIDMSEITVIVSLILLCTGASFVQRVCGFGFGVFIMTMLPYLCPSYGEATTLSGILSALQSLYVLLVLYRLVDWKRLILISLSFTLFSFFAIKFVASATDSILKILLGIVLILLSLYFLFVSPKLQVKPTKTLQVSMGALSGIMGGLFGMHGPPAVIYFLAVEVNKYRYMAVCQAYFLLTNIIMTFFRAQNGFLTPFVGWGCLYACVGVVIGSFLGRKVFDKLPTEKLRNVIYIYMIFSGIVAIVF
ncbi:MAG: sulfite exporter TauE/SafE family protein [Bacteroidales bacterium]|nr:sulfite exporter TauE/SafE family protein [Bacteroidales bacterium]